jgi:hypothetical protein
MREMRLPNLTLRRRIIIAVLAIAVIHALFRWLPGYIERRPRFYGDAWARAVEILKEEVGPAAVENGVFYIPREGAWRFTSAFMVRPSLDAIVWHPGPDLSALLDRKVARLSRREAQQLLATFRYLSLVKVRTMPPPCRDRTRLEFYVFDGRHMLLDYDGRQQGNLFDVRVASNAVGRFSRMLAVSDDIEPVESDDEIASALCRVLKSCTPPRNRFEAALIDHAANGLWQHPARDAVPDLAIVNRLIRTRQREGRWSDVFRKLPLVGRFFSRELQDWEQDWRGDFIARSVLSKALWCCENLAGKSEAEQIAAWERAIFGKEPEDCPTSLFVRNHREEFARLLLKHWDSVSSDHRRSVYLNDVRNCDPDTVREIAGRLAESEYPVFQVHANRTLYELTGERKYIDRLLEIARSSEDSATPSARIDTNRVLYELTGDHKYIEDLLEITRLPEDPAALTVDKHSEIRQNVIEPLLGLYTQHPSLDAVRDRLIDTWQSLSDAGLEWRVMRMDFFADRVCSALIRAGGRENIEVAMAMIRKEGEDQQLEASRQGYLWRPSLSCEKDLLSSRDPHLSDAILDYLRGELPGLSQSAWFTLARVLALKGDERLAVLFREALPRVEEIEAQSPSLPIRLDDPDLGTPDLSKPQVVKGLIAIAEDRVGFILDLPDREREIALLIGGTALFRGYTEEELLALMAEERCEPLLFTLYQQLLTHRWENR